MKQYDIVALITMGYDETNKMRSRIT